jgi:hypothetical protein
MLAQSVLYSAPAMSVPPSTWRILLFLMGLVYGPLGAWLPGLFPARVRYTGASLAFNVGHPRRRACADGLPRLWPSAAASGPWVPTSVAPLSSAWWPLRGPERVPNQPETLLRAYVTHEATVRLRTYDPTPGVAHAFVELGWFLDLLRAPGRALCAPVLLRTLSKATRARLSSQAGGAHVGSRPAQLGPTKAAAICKHHAGDCDRYPRKTTCSVSTRGTLPCDEKRRPKAPVRGCPSSAGRASRETWRNWFALCTR